jgi:hypothetical protein
MDDLWRVRAPGVEHCSTRAQLLCLRSYLRDKDGLGDRVAYAYSGLSRASHHHAYELPPTAGELANWMDTVGDLIGAVAALPTRN